MNVLAAAFLGARAAMATAVISELTAAIQLHTRPRAVILANLPASVVPAAVAAVGGHAGVYPCHSSFAAVNHSAQTALAWKLHVTLERVGTSMRHPGVMFIGPHDSIDGGAPAISPRLNRIQLIKQVGPWKIYRVWRAGHSTACVGS